MNIFKALFGGRKRHTDDTETDGTDIERLRRDGLAALEQGQAALAVQNLMRVVEAVPADTGSRYSLGMAYEALGDLAHAYDELQTVAQARPGDVEVLLRIASVAGRMHSYTAMGEWCEKALLADSSNARVYDMYARACQALGDATNAEAMATRAMMLANGEKQEK